MDTMWEKIKSGLRSSATVSIEKIDEYTKIGKLKIEEYAARRKIERNLIDIGERVIDLLDDGKSSEVGSDLAVIGSVSNIKALKEEIVQIDARVKEISDAAKAAAAARKTATNETSKDGEEEPSGI